MKEVIIIGGGWSVKEGIDKGLWNKIKGKNVWSLNFAYKVLPYLPTRQVWVDINFFENNITDLQKLWEKDVQMVARHNRRYVDLPQITTYETTRHAKIYKPKEALKTASTPHLFHGKKGLVGTFALSLAVGEGYDIIYLLGYDFGTKDSKQEKTHFYQGDIEVISSGVNNPRIYLSSTDEKVHDSVTDYEVFTNLGDVKIYNVSMISNIQCLKKISYEQFFKQIGEKNV